MNLHDDARNALPPDRPLTDSERYPGLSPGGRRFLRSLEEHPAAPAFNHRCGDRLTTENREAIARFRRELSDSSESVFRPDQPAWVDPFMERVVAQVPFHRRRCPPGASALQDLPTCSRHDFARGIWDFVPDDVPLRELIVHSTSGRTGRPLDLPHHPVASSKYLALMQAMLAAVNVDLLGEPEAVAVALVGAQRHTLTLASLSSYLHEAGFLKLNLTPAAWRDFRDPLRYLDAFPPSVYTGDPLAFAELAKLPLASPPAALLSTAMHLTAGLQQSLEERFACPVIDVYSAMEAGPIAFRRHGAVFGGIPYDIHLEILRDDSDEPAAPAQPGEITLTGGRNPFLPLLRYRTGDYAVWHEVGRSFERLEGRAPVRFLGSDGEWINNIDVTHALQRFPITAYHLHQRRNGSFRLRLRGVPAGGARGIREALAHLLGPRSRIDLEPLAPERLSGKFQQYTSDLPADPEPGSNA